MIRATFAIPGALDTPTGGYAYDRALIAAGPAAALTLEHLALPGGFPLPDAAALARAADLLAGAPADRPLLVDGLALGAMPDAALARIRAPLVGLLHHPLALEAGLAPMDAAALRASEGVALRRARAIIVTSAATARTAAEMFDLPSKKFTVARPGLPRAERAAGGAARPMILSVGSLIPRKGHDVLIAALALIADLDWDAAIYGSADFTPLWAADLRAARDRAGLRERVTMHGAVSAPELAAAYHGADIFCLPTRYEGYGMVFAEAMAHGLPVVAADIAAAREVVPPAAGALAAVDDAAALAAVLRGVLTDTERRAAMGAAAHAHARAMPGWDETARLVRAALERIGS